jgi:phage/conjugal plasmid C-4 type zinc finger TraR family protein
MTALLFWLGDLAGYAEIGKRNVRSTLGRTLGKTYRAAAKRAWAPIKREEKAMATGWAGDGAVQDQIDATINDAIKRARSKAPKGPSLKRCEECDAKIPEARRKAVPGVRLCVSCQDARDKEEAAFSGYNRRGSKDSQLR